MEESEFIELEQKKIYESQEFYWTAAIANALLINGNPYEDYAELIDEAIAIRQELEKKIGEELTNID